MSAIGVTPAIGSFENSPMRKASAPASLPSRYTGLPLMPGDHARVFDLRPMQPDQDNVALGPVRVVQDAENFHVHGLRLDAFKYRVGNAAHAGMDLIHGDGRLRSLSGQDYCG